MLSPVDQVVKISLQCSILVQNMENGCATWFKKSKVELDVWGSHKMEMMEGVGDM